MGSSRQNKFAKRPLNKGIDSPPVIPPKNNLKNNHSKKRSQLDLTMIVIAVVFILGIILMSPTITFVQEFRASSKLKKELVQVENESKSIDKEFERFNNDSYVIAHARDSFKILPGETPIKILDTETVGHSKDIDQKLTDVTSQNNDEVKSYSKPWYEKIYDSVKEYSVPEDDTSKK